MADLAARLRARVDRSADCWVWTGGTTRGGQGLIHADGFTRQVHRVSYELAFGPIPSGAHVLRTCGTAACVRPEHLILGDDASAAQLRAARGRTASGDRHGFRRHPEAVPSGQQHYAHKLTWRDVRSIRERYAAGEVTTRALADEYGVRHSTLWEIVTGRSWRQSPIPSPQAPPPNTSTRNYPRKLTWRDVASIRERYTAGGLTMRTLAAEYGVRQSTVWKILTGRSWPQSSHGATR